jgi:HAMP domain-containing protein
VFVESPRAEAFAPMVKTLQRTSLVLVVALLISIAASFFLARALVRPLRALQEGAAQIGAGDLERHIDVRTGDELEVLAGQFNHMSAQLRESYCRPRAQGRPAHRRAARSARASDRDGRDPARHQRLGRRPPAGVPEESSRAARTCSRARSRASC